MNIFKRISDHRISHSLAWKLRKKRFALFKVLISSLTPPLKILDVGGTQKFWETMEFLEENEIEILLLNLNKVRITHKNFYCVVGDARDMKQFKDNEFDVVFSNSVIEHLGSYADQSRMANEIKRIGKRYFLQTPNRYFPIEPHFLFPFFQFLPLRVKAWSIRHSNIGWQKKVNDRQEAYRIVSSIRLLSKRELLRLFPRGVMKREHFLGLTKSFIIYGGWDCPSHKM